MLYEESVLIRTGSPEKSLPFRKVSRHQLKNLDVLDFFFFFFGGGGICCFRSRWQNHSSAIYHPLFLLYFGTLLELTPANVVNMRLWVCSIHVLNLLHYSSLLASPTL